MITFFTTAKPFVGHNGVIQRNALRSWTLLHPDMEIILFGDDAGAGEVARELSLRHEPQVERNDFGTIRIDSMFCRAQALAQHEIVCYSNCDIILLPDFIHAIDRIRSKHEQFLAIGRRWNADISEPIDFANPDWQKNVRDIALISNQQQEDWFIDYFVFSRRFFGAEIPPLGVGRIYWDNWIVWKALQGDRLVLDISPVVIAVHQNHNYAHHPLGKSGVYEGEEVALNLRLAGGKQNLRCIGDATHVVLKTGIRKNFRRHWTQFDRAAPTLARFLRFRVWNPTFFFLLGITRPLRAALGLRSPATLARSKK
jgi:hypothetical protein